MNPFHHFTYTNEVPVFREILILKVLEFFFFNFIKLILQVLKFFFIYLMWLSSNTYHLLEVSSTIDFSFCFLYSWLTLHERPNVSDRYLLQRWFFHDQNGDNRDQLNASNRYYFGSLISVLSTNQLFDRLP